MEARQQCFKGECEIRQLKKEMRRDKLQLKELEQQISVLKSKRKDISILCSTREHAGARPKSGFLRHPQVTPCHRGTGFDSRITRGYV